MVNQRLRRAATARRKELMGQKQRRTEVDFQFKSRRVIFLGHFSVIKQLKVVKLVLDIKIKAGFVTISSIMLLYPIKPGLE